MASAAMTPAVFEGLIAILVLADGLIHLALDIVVLSFDFSRGGPLPYLFLLNFFAYMSLAALFLVSRRAPAGRRRVVDLVIAAFALVTFVAWWYFTGGRGNPLNLGYTSKTIEAVLFVLVLVHWRSLNRVVSTPA